MIAEPTESLISYRLTAAAYQRLYSFIGDQSEKADANPTDCDNALADLETLRKAAADKHQAESLQKRLQESYP